jgi:hypothetical protein
MSQRAAIQMKSLSSTRMPASRAASLKAWRVQATLSSLPSQFRHARRASAYLGPLVRGRVEEKVGGMSQTPDRTGMPGAEQAHENWPSKPHIVHASPYFCAATTRRTEVGCFIGESDLVSGELIDFEPSVAGATPGRGYLSSGPRPRDGQELGPRHIAGRGMLGGGIPRLAADL